jgi:integrase
MLQARIKHKKQLEFTTTKVSQLMSIKRTYYQKIYLRTVEFGSRHLPVIFLADGKAGYIINQYIYWLFRRNMPPSTLRSHITSLCHLYAFTFARYENQMTPNGAESLLADFIDAKLSGTDHYCNTMDPDYSWLHNLCLNWQPIALKSTIRQYLYAINKFDKWQTDNQETKPLNPFEIRVMSELEIFREFERRKNWDMYLHLDKARSKTKKTYKHDVDSQLKEHQHLDRARKQVKSNKAFPYEKFVELIESSNNLRDKLLWLLMGGGGLRLSECLNVFMIDITGRDNRYAAANVVLAHPEVGMVTWNDQSGTTHHSTRSDFITNRYSNKHLPKTSPLYELLPRTKYPESEGSLWAGWKGMVFHFRDTEKTIFTDNAPLSHPYDVNHLIWIHPTIGRYFYRVFEDYLATHYMTNHLTGRPADPFKHHPWLLCNIAEPYGHPFRLSSAYRAWSRALSNIGMTDCGLAPHSLRHMFGGLCAAYDDIDLATAQGLLRHSSIESTKVYFHATESDARDIIYRHTDPRYALQQKSIDFNFPSHWEEL